MNLQFPEPPWGSVGLGSHWFLLLKPWQKTVLEVSAEAAATRLASPVILLIHGESRRFILFYFTNSYCCPLPGFAAFLECLGINFSWKCCKNKKVMPLPTLFQKVFKWKKVFSIFNKHLQYYWVGFFVHITRLIMLSDTFKACLTKIQRYNGLLCTAFFLHSNHNQH